MSDLESWLANNKALWGRVYDEVILPDLEKEWKKRIENDETESKTKDERIQTLTNHIANDVVAHAKLKDENARLKSLLQKHRSTTPSADELASITEDATIPIKEYHEISKKFDELNKRFQDAAQRIKYLERKNVAVMQKNKEMKDSVRAWQEYADRHIERKKRKSEAKTTRTHPRSNLAVETPRPIPSIPSSPGSAAMRTPRSLIPQERSSPALFAALADVIGRSHTPDTTDTGGVGEGDAEIERDANTAIEEHREVEQRVGTENHSSPLHPTEEARADTTSSSNNDRTAFLDHFSSDKITSSQTTILEVVEQDHEKTPRANHVDDDDEPEFVSERSLKRKRNPSNGLNIFHDGLSDGTPAKPVRVKEELYSSPPPESAANQLLRMETMDLDELGPNPIITPRRRRLRRLDSSHSNETGTLRNSRSNSVPFSGNLVKAEPTEEVHLAETVRGSRLAAELEDARAVNEPGDEIMEPREILQPLDPNVVANRTTDGTRNKRIKREEARKETEFNMLAESGETQPPGHERKKRLPPNLARAHFNEKIRATKSGQSLKNALTTPKTAPTRTSAAQVPTPPSSTRPTYTPSARPAQRKLQAPAPAPRSEIVPDNRPVWRMSALEPAREAPAPAARPQSPQGRLRDKPIAELRIQDFKPNPVFNQGYTHAFTDTVRRREDRLCLPGCTNATCCGSTFRTLALAAAPLTSSQEEALLQEYLGDAYDSFGLTQMEKSEKDEIVLQARTRKLATEHGKHRRAYEGRKTPPGFWRVDFPSTQEAEQDREKAVQMQEEEIRKRYIEAMRRGGRYVFADE